MYCSHCGNEVLNEAIVCPKCGVSLETEPASKKNEQISKNLGPAIIIGVIIAIISCSFLISTTVA